MRRSSHNLYGWSPVEFLSIILKQVVMTHFSLPEWRKIAHHNSLSVLNMSKKIYGELDFESVAKAALRVHSLVWVLIRDLLYLINEL